MEKANDSDAFGIRFAGNTIFTSSPVRKSHVTVVVAPSINFFVATLKWFYRDTMTLSRRTKVQVRTPTHESYRQCVRLFDYLLPVSQQTHGSFYPHRTAWIVSIGIQIEFILIMDFILLLLCPAYDVRTYVCRSLGVWRTETGRLVAAAGSNFYISAS